MKKIIILALFFAVPFFSVSKDNPFAPSGKYGTLRTKQVKTVFSRQEYRKNYPFATGLKSGKHKTKKNKPVKQRESWIYRQWTRN